MIKDKIIGPKFRLWVGEGSGKEPIFDFFLQAFTEYFVYLSKGCEPIVHRLLSFLVH